MAYCFLFFPQCRIQSYLNVNAVMNSLRIVITYSEIYHPTDTDENDKIIWLSVVLLDNDIRKISHHREIRSLGAKPVYEQIL